LALPIFHVIIISNLKTFGMPNDRPMIASKYSSSQVLGEGVFTVGGFILMK
jgi:hypothetical protein